MSIAVPVSPVVRSEDEGQGWTEARVTGLGIPEAQWQEPGL